MGMMGFGRTTSLHPSPIPHQPISTSSSFDKPLERLQEKHQHIFFGERGGRAECFLRLEHAVTTASAGATDDTRLIACRIQEQLDEVFRAAIRHETDAGGGREHVEQLSFGEE